MATKKAPAKKVAAKKVPVKKAVPKKKAAAKKATPKKKAAKKVETPVIEKDEDPGYEVVVGDEIVDDVDKGEERAVHDDPANYSVVDPTDNADWIHPGVQSIPTPLEEMQLKAQGEADREAKRLADELEKQLAEAALLTPEEKEILDKEKV